LNQEQNHHYSLSSQGKNTVFKSKVGQGAKSALAKEGDQSRRVAEVENSFHIGDISGE
jgi:hypothetical protein